MSLTAYFDDSGTDRLGPICLIAGYIASTEQWQRFSDDWQATLDAEPAIAYFKATEAEHRRGQFREWGAIDIHTKLSKFARVIRKHVMGAVGSMIGCRVYDQIARGRFPDTIDHPYWPCFSKISLFTLFLYRGACEAMDCKIDYVFDQQSEGFERRANLIHHGWGEIVQTEHAAVLGELRFGNDKQVLPLQAADMLAWHLRRHGADMLDGRDDYRPAAEILGSVPVVTADWMPDDLAEFVDWYNENHPFSPVNRPDLHKPRQRDRPKK